MPEAILGISAYYHDSAAALLVDGRLVAAAQEERFTRKKHDPGFPTHAVRYVLGEAGLQLADVVAVAYYDKPFLKFERLLETYHALAPRGLRGFLAGVPVWIREKLLMRQALTREFVAIGGCCPRLLFPEHHLSHASSAFFPSPFSEAAILTLDGVGEWATTTIGVGHGRWIRVLRQLDFPHSLGLLYSAFTVYCGFRVNSGEYKLMGLAPYGHREGSRVAEWKAKIYDQLVDVREDGSFLLNMRYFDFATGLSMCNDRAWSKLFGIPPRQPESEPTQEYMDLALAVQEVTEEIVLKLAATARRLTGCRQLVLAGGVALNCVANGRLLRSGLFEDLWIQPAAGDAGGALGAALAAWYIGMARPRSIVSPDGMRGALLGPEFSGEEIQAVARRYGASFRQSPDFARLCEEVARLLVDGKVVGWFQGRMEYGPRALGNRSILGDPRGPEMQKNLNLKVKFREGFRPFAPSVQDESLDEYFQLDRPSPYMLLVAPVQSRRCLPLPERYHEWPLYDRLYQPRSDLPAVTHVDYSARVQSVGRETNPRYWLLIDYFRKLTGCGVLTNTSFNVRGEPIVCSPEDAYRCFMATGIDYLVMGDYLFDKREQPALIGCDGIRGDHALD